MQYQVGKRLQSAKIFRQRVVFLPGAPADGEDSVRVVEDQAEFLFDLLVLGGSGPIDSFRGQHLREQLLFKALVITIL